MLSVDAGSWVYARPGQSCAAGCSSLGGCETNPWPDMSRPEMESISGKVCTSYEAGASYLNPMIDGKGVCYFHGESRCPGTTSSHRFCRCHNAESSPPSPSQSSGRLAELQLVIATCALLVALATIVARAANMRAVRIMIGVPMFILAALCCGFAIYSATKASNTDESAFNTILIVWGSIGFFATLCIQQKGMLTGGTRCLAAIMLTVYIAGIIVGIYVTLEPLGEGFASRDGEVVAIAVTCVWTCLALFCLVRSHYIHIHRTKEESLLGQLRDNANQQTHSANDTHAVRAAQRAHDEATEQREKAEQALEKSEAERLRLARLVATSNDAAHGTSAIWECNVDGKWVPYSGQTASVLEAGYSAKLTDLQFTYRNHTYTLDTTAPSMFQANISTKAQRQVRRTLERDRISGAASWSAQPADQNCVLLPVNSVTGEYKSVLDHLRATIPSAKIARLDRIQNVLLWDYYCTRKDRMRKVNGKEPAERAVWHGTRSHAPSLVYEDKQDGFMMQYCESGMWGKGIYFAENASYSDSYAHRNTSRQKVLMLTKLLTGEETHVMPHNRGLKFPPNKPNGVRYDTVTGDTGGSKVYVVYENGRAYPEYLVTYTS